MVIPFPIPLNTPPVTTTNFILQYPSLPNATVMKAIYRFVEFFGVLILFLQIRFDSIANTMAQDLTALNHLLKATSKDVIEKCLNLVFISRLESPSVNFG